MGCSNLCVLLISMWAIVRFWADVYVVFCMVYMLLYVITAVVYYVGCCRICGLVYAT